MLQQPVLRSTETAPSGWQVRHICKVFAPIWVVTLGSPSGEQVSWFVDKSFSKLGESVAELNQKQQQDLSSGLRRILRDKSADGLEAFASVQRVAPKTLLELESLLPHARYDRAFEFGQVIAAGSDHQMVDVSRIKADPGQPLPSEFREGWSIAEVGGQPALKASRPRSVIRFEKVPKSPAYYLGFAYGPLKTHGRLRIDVNGRVIAHNPLRPIGQHELPRLGYWVPPELVDSGVIEVTIEHEMASRQPSDTLVLQYVRLAVADTPTSEPAALSASDLMMRFQSLGDNCQFGGVQRHFGVEPIGLLRFAGLPDIVGMIDANLEGLGDTGTVGQYAAGDVRAEHMIHEKVYGIKYHTFKYVDQISVEDVIAENEIKLKFLRRKFIEDLEDSEVIWLYRSSYANDPNEIFALHMAMRRYGPNKLLWVTPAPDDRHAGGIEWLGPRLLRGYLAPEASFWPGVFNPLDWENICRSAYRAFQMR